MKDLTGRHYGKWTVLDFVRRVGTSYYWRCQCECGREKEVTSANLYSGNSKSCGCLRKEAPLKHGATSGHRTTKEYRAWYNAKRRCYNPHYEHYKDYGGRGIVMCDEWKGSFESFLSDMGPSPKGYTLERINVDGNYAPSNCKWATSKEQARNRRNNVSKKEACLS